MKKIKQVLCMTLAALATFSACGRTPSNNDDPNSSKTTTLVVASYNGGVGNVWLDSIIEKFEAENKETALKYEELMVNKLLEIIKEQAVSA